MVCIGGGRSGGEGIRFVSGTFEMSSNGINVVCVGSSLGDAVIQIGKVSLTARGEGNEVLLVGSVSGKAKIVSCGDLSLSAACERATGIGTISGTADILFEGGRTFVSTGCDSGAVIGTFGGEFTMVSRNTLIRVHGEGNQVAGIGSLAGAGETRIESGEIHGDLLAGERMILGNQESRCVITGGNFHLTGDESLRPVSPDGTPLIYITPTSDHYENTFRDRRETWTYVADRNAEGTLGVFIPYGPDA